MRSRNWTIFLERREYNNLTIAVTEWYNPHLLSKIYSMITGHFDHLPLWSILISLQFTNITYLSLSQNGTVQFSLNWPSIAWLLVILTTYHCPVYNLLQSLLQSTFNSMITGDFDHLPLWSTMVRLQFTIITLQLN